MEESHGEGPASHPDPESCVDGRKAGGEALTGAHAGQPSSCEIKIFGVPTRLVHAEGHTDSGDMGESLATLRSQRPCTRVETPRTGTGRSQPHPRATRVGQRRPQAGRLVRTGLGSRRAA